MFEKSILEKITKAAGQVIDSSVEEVLPDNVELYDFDDFGKLRSNIYDKTKESLSKTFPATYGNVRVELEDLDYEDPEYYSLAEQKDALLQDKFLNRRLRGTINLIDNDTEELIESKKTTLMQVPFLTDRGTFIHNGNEYSISNQLRLQSGIYSRKKQNGHLETQFNIKRGTGSGFRLRFEPESNLYKVDIGGSSIKLYSLLNMLGVDDDTLKQKWGEDIFNANKEKFDARDFEKAYTKFLGYKADKNATSEEKIKQLKEVLSSGKLDFNIAKRNLPNYFKNKK